LNRLKKDTSEMSKEGIDCFHAVLDNGWLYFTAEEETGVNLYRFKLNGDGYSEIISESIHPDFIIEDSKIYYSLREGLLRTCSLNGDSVSEIGKVKTGKFTVSNNTIFYINRDDGNCLYRIGCNGNKNQKISSLTVKDFNVTEHYIYYTQAEELNQDNIDSFNESYNLYYMEKEDDTPKKITNGRITDIQVIEDSVYFRINYQLYHLQNDNKTFKRVVAKGGCNESISETATKTFSLSSAGNFNNGGQVSIAEDSVLLSYHTDETDTLIRVKKNGTEEQTISSRLLYYNILAQGEEVYYNIDTYNRANWIEANLIRKSLSSNDENPSFTILDFPCSYLVQNDSLFFSSSWYTTFFRQNLTTGKRYCLSSDRATCINLYKEHLYFINEDKTIVKLQVDGSTRTVLREKATSALTMDEDALYYIGEDDFLYTMDLEGKNEKLLLQEPVEKFNLSDQWIYYIPQTKPSQVWRISKNGDQKEIIYSDVCYGIYTHQETVYLYGFTENQYCILQILPNGNLKKFYPIPK
jgi:hypothetical protein